MLLPWEFKFLASVPGWVFDQSPKKLSIVIDLQFCSLLDLLIDSYTKISEHHLFVSDQTCESSAKHMAGLYYLFIGLNKAGEKNERC